MAIFIPRWEWYKEKKPSAPQQINWNNSLTDSLRYVLMDGKELVTETSSLATAADFTRGGMYANGSAQVSYSSALDKTTTKIAFLVDYAKVDSGYAYDSARLFGRTANNGATSPWLNYDLEMDISAESYRWAFIHSVSGGPISTMFFNAPPEGRNKLLASLNGTDKRLYINGALASSATVSQLNLVTANSNLVIGGDGGSAQNTKSIIYSVIAWEICPDFKEISEYPYQILKPLLKVFYVGASGAVDLGGSAQGAASATGDLDPGVVNVELAGAGIALVTAAGVINQSVDISASAASIAAANGAVSMEITLAGDGFIEAFASGALAQAMSMEGAAQATADSAGGLAAAVDLSANAASTTDATGQVGLTMTLAGAALIEALATAGLDPGGQGLAADAAAAVAAAGDIVMTTEASAAAQAVADAASAVSIDTALAAAAAAQANATGDLTPGAAGFAADAQAIATAEAALFATVPLLGDAVVTVTGSAGVSIDMPLASAAVSVAAGTGDLTVGLGGLSASAIAEAIAGGNITMTLTISAAALMTAVVGASLTVLGVYRLPVGIYRISSLTPVRQISSLTPVRQIRSLTYAS